MLDIISFLTGGGNRIKLKRHEYIRVGLMGIAIFGVLVMSVLELKYFNNTFEAKSMVTRALILGVLIGAALSYWITKDRLDKPAMETLLKFQISIAILVFSIILMPLLASFSNRVLSFGRQAEVPVEYVAAQGFYADRYGLLDSPEPNGYFLFVLKDGQLERFKTKTNPYPNAKENETILLTVKKGFWGYEYVDF